MGEWLLVPTVTAAKTPSTGTKGSGRDVVTLQLHHQEHPGGGFGSGDWPPGPTTEVSDAYKALANKFKQGEEWAAVLRVRAALTTAEADLATVEQSLKDAETAYVEDLADGLFRGKKAVDLPKIELSLLG